MDGLGGTPVTPLQLILSRISGDPTCGKGDDGSESYIYVDMFIEDSLDQDCQTSLAQHVSTFGGGGVEVAKRMIKPQTSTVMNGDAESSYQTKRVALDIFRFVSIRIPRGSCLYVWICGVS